MTDVWHLSDVPRSGYKAPPRFLCHLVKYIFHDSNCSFRCLGVVIFIVVRVHKSCTKWVNPPSIESATGLGLIIEIVEISRVSSIRQYAYKAI
jgi:hypothetical protein